MPHRLKKIKHRVQCGILRVLCAKSRVNKHNHLTYRLAARAVQQVQNRRLQGRNQGCGGVGRRWLLRWGSAGRYLLARLGTLDQRGAVRPSVMTGVD